MEDLEVVIIILIILLCWRLLSKCCFHEGFSTSVIKDLTTFGGRQSGTLGHHNSYLYLIEKVKSLNVQEVQWAPGYTQNFKYNGIKHKNIVFTIKGELRNPKILVFAHYDHIGPGFPGGNDNASGVFALLQIAKRMTRVKDIYYDIVFVLSDGEESGMYGSQVVADILPANNLVINIDTIGGFPEGDIVRIANDGSYQTYLTEKAKEKNMDVDLIDIQPGRSDITNFTGFNECVEFGYPTKAGHYHTHEDTYDNLYQTNMIKIIQMVGDLVNDVSLGKLPIAKIIR